jgi:hypothetical protein
MENYEANGSTLHGCIPSQNLGASLELNLLPSEKARESTQIEWILRAEIESKAMAPTLEIRKKYSYFGCVSATLYRKVAQNVELNGIPIPYPNYLG